MHHQVWHLRVSSPCSLPPRPGSWPHLATPRSGHPWSYQIRHELQSYTPSIRYKIKSFCNRTSIYNVLSWFIRSLLALLYRPQTWRLVRCGDKYHFFYHLPLSCFSFHTPSCMFQHCEPIDEATDKVLCKLSEKISSYLVQSTRRYLKNGKLA